jgi:hypothetical protein
MGNLTHAERATKAQELMDDGAHQAGAGNPTMASYLLRMSQIHATLAVYEALVLSRGGDLPRHSVVEGMSVGEYAWTRGWGA